MFSEEEWKTYEPMILKYLASMVDGLVLNNVNDLNSCSARTLLEIANKIDDFTLVAFVGIIKRSDMRGSLFEKLMGDFSEENSELVENFLARYRGMVLQDEDYRDFNPLIVYLSVDCFQDIVFMHSREAFFKRQTIAHVNDFFNHVFGGDFHFTILEHDEAWRYFMNRIIGEDLNDKH